VRLFGRNGLQAQLLRVNIFAEQPPPQPRRRQQQQQQQQEAQRQQAAASSSSSNAAVKRGRYAAAAAAAAAEAAAAAAQDAAEQPPSQQPPSQQHQQQQQRQRPPQPLASVRVLPKEVHLNSVSLAVENLKLLFCPRDRRVRVNIPVKLWNDDVSPGVRSGGWLHVVNRSVPVLARGDAVRPRVTLDVRHMRTKDVLRLRDVALWPGAALAARDPLQPVVRCALRVGGE
jgi:hypothetical protein